MLNPTWVRLSTAGRAVAESATVFGRDVANGLLVIGHNALATVGTATVLALALCLGNDVIRQNLEVSVLEWLQERNETRAQAQGDSLQSQATPNAVDRATAADIRNLPAQQARLAQWISRRYRVAPEPVAALVQEAWLTGRRTQLDPTLILAVMAIESRFNPFAQSPVGAQGLMQVMTRVHDDKYESFGGTHAAFDPVTNLRVGTQVLKDAINRGGSVEEGLRHYVGAALLDDDGGYAAKVVSEQGHMQAVLAGKTVPLNASNPATPNPRVLPASGAEAPSPLDPAPRRDAPPPSAPPGAVDERVAMAR
jgi:hypothetical protein